VGGALTLALSAGNGQVLRAHKTDLPRITLAGGQGMLPGRASMGATVVFDGLDFQSAQLQGINLNQAYLSSINFSSAKLFGADLQFTHLQGADLRWADARFSTFDGARMQGALLNDAAFFGARLFVVDLRGASLDGTMLQSAYLNGAKLEGARLLNIRFDENTDFTGASIDNSTIIAIAKLKQGLYNSAEQNYPEDFIVDEERTSILRSELMARGLVLPQGYGS
jgi:uncharacterized protein YjbI with pentapeptide repeats